MTAWKLLQTGNWNERIHNLVATGRRTGGSRAGHGYVLFIDASQHFEKVKTQNVLRDDHIDKIVETYRNRIEEDKYSKKATLQLIADNDYNLNIPRYVDTFEAEDQIDIEAIALEIKGLDNRIKENDIILADFCKQLNILTPF